MNIAITGATGFIGRYLVHQLASAGHHLRCWHRPSSDLGNFAAEPGQLEWIPGELGNIESCHTLVANCDAVIHAGLWRPGQQFRGGEGNLVQFTQTNLIGTLQLIEAAREHLVPRFIFISTCAVHEVILPDRKLDENHPLWPLSHYGAHKAALEKFVHSYGLGEGYDICALRPTGVYGLRQPAAASKWYELVQGICQGTPIHCRGGGKEVHARDVARAAALLLHADGIAGQSYNCYDQYISQWDVAQLAQQIGGTQTEIHGAPTYPKHQIENHKLKQLGMEFGGMELLEATIRQIMEAVQRA